MEDAWNRITNTPHAVGHNYQVMDLVDGTVVDIEMAPFSRVCDDCISTLAWSLHCIA